MSHLFTGLFDSRFDGVDVFWIAVAVGLILLLSIATRRARAQTLRASRALEAEARRRASEPFGALFDECFAGDDPWHPTRADMKAARVVDADAIERQTRAHSYLAGSHARAAIDGLTRG